MAHEKFTSQGVYIGLSAYLLIICLLAGIFIFG